MSLSDPITLLTHYTYATSSDLMLSDAETGANALSASKLHEIQNWAAVFQRDYPQVRTLAANRTDLIQSLDILAQKVRQIQTRLQPFLRAIPSVSSLPTPHIVLKDIFSALARGDETRALTLLPQLPSELQGRIFQAMWLVMGKPMGIHADYGRAAFCNFDKMNAPLAKKQEAVQIAVLLEMADIFGRNDESALAYFDLLRPDIQGKVFENTWVVMGKPNGHPDYGRVGFLNQESSIVIPPAKKKEAVEKTISFYLDPTPSAATSAPTVATPVVHSTQAAQLASIQSLAQSGFVAFYDAAYHPATAFMGNFHPCRFEFDGITYTGCSEAAFQAQKFGNREFRLKFRDLDGDGAFHLGQTRDPSYDTHWDSKKDDMMMNVLRAKFGQNPELKPLLLATGNAYLIEHNTRTGKDSYWSDNFDGTGQNKLGILLMQLRAEYGGTGVVPKPTACYTHFGHALPGGPVVASLQTPSKTFTCSYNGCKSPCYVEPTTSKVHKFCGRTHAAAYTSQFGVEPCSLPGCASPRFTEVGGRVHDFCGRAHAAAARTLSN
jgi:ribA/ribD-fused uncharacterized protein